MPYSFESNKTPLPRSKDRRVKLTDSDRLAIYNNVESKTQRQLASQYGVSRRLIGFIQRPETLKKNLERREERGGWKQYYDKDEHADSMREHRRYKNEVLND